MFQGWSFQRRLAAGFILLVVVVMASALVTLLASRSIVAIGVSGQEHARDLVEAQKLRQAGERKMSNSLAYMLDGDTVFADGARRVSAEMRARISALRAHIQSPAGIAALDEIERLERIHQDSWERTISRTAALPVQSRLRVFESEMIPHRGALDQALNAFVAHKESLMVRAERGSMAAMGRARGLVTTLLGIEFILLIGFTTFLGTRLARIYRREAEARQTSETSTRQLRLISDALPVLIAYVDRDEHYQFANRTYESWLDRPLAKIEHHSVREVMGAETYASMRPWVKQALAGTPVTFQIEIRGAAGTRQVEAHCIPDFGPDAGVRGFVGLFSDISDRKRSDEERERLLAAEREARGELERSSRIKDDFLATLSHELRTPLQAILGWSRLMRTGKLRSEETARAIETIERNASAQAQLIEDLLDMSRIVAGKLRLGVQRVDLIQVLEAALQTLQPAASAKQIEIRTRLDPQVGMVRGDPQRLQQIVWNLLSNAIKFAPKAGLVEIVLRQANASVEIVVRDNGRGIRPEFLPHVFERFRQSDASTTRQHAGLGLGLSIARNLVELHGGTITVASEGENRGATFTVTLPSMILRGSPEGGGATEHGGSPGHSTSMEQEDSRTRGAAAELPRFATPGGREPGVPEPGVREPMGREPRGSASMLPERGVPERGASERGASEHADHMRAALHAATEHEAVTMTGIQVLVVDDDTDARELLRRVFEERGATVTLASSAQEALAAYERNAPDVIVSDIGMPDEDGYSLIQAVRSRESAGRLTPAIALTAFARPEDRSRALVAGFQAHAPKPIDPAELAALVAALARSAAIETP